MCDKSMRYGGFANRKTTTKNENAVPAGPRNGDISNKQAIKTARILDKLSWRLDQVARAFDPLDSDFPLVLDLIEAADAALPDTDLEDEPDHEPSGDDEDEPLIAHLDNHLNWGFRLVHGCPDEYHARPDIIAEWNAAFDREERERSK